MKRRAVIAVAVLLVAGVVAVLLLRTRTPDLGGDIVQANGRIEVERVEIAAKFPGRVAAVRVQEGDPVAAGEVVAEMDDADLRAERAAAIAAVHRAEQNVNRAEAEVAIREADLGLADVELRRASELQSRNTGTPAEVDRRTAQRNVAKAALEGARAAVGDAKAGWSVQSLNQRHGTSPRLEVRECSRKPGSVSAWVEHTSGRHASRDRSDRASG